MSAGKVDPLAALEAVDSWAREVSDEHIDSDDGLRKQYRQDLQDGREALAAITALVAAAREYRDASAAKDADHIGASRAYSRYEEARVGLIDALSAFPEAQP